MKKLFEKAYADSQKCRKFSRIALAISWIALLFSLFVAGFIYQQQSYDISRLDRTVVINNGITFDIKPSYKDGQLRINLNVSKGWARLYDDENYFVHLVDSDGFDITGIKFYERDFSWDADNVHRAYKRITVDKNKLKKGVKFKLLIPLRIDDI